MKRLRMLLMTGALIAGSAAMAPAQQPQYNQGYQNYPGYQDRDWDRDRDRDRDRYGYDRGNGFRNAREFGFQDGFNDGRNDRLSGHSFRPTHDGNFRHADRGYDGRFMSRNEYKQIYREAYQNGYERGYNSARNRDRWHW